MYRYFIITFEDSTFECIAREVELLFFKNIAMKTALLELSESW